MSVHKRPHDPRDREGVIAAIGVHPNRLQTPDTKPSTQSPAEAVVDDVIDRLYDQLVMDALVLRVADEIEWDDADCDLMKQHRSVRFHDGERNESTNRNPMVELSLRYQGCQGHDTPGAMEVEKDVEVKGKMEAEEMNRNGERCFNRSDRAVRPSVADFLPSFSIKPLLRNTEKMKTQLLSAL